MRTRTEGMSPNASGQDPALNQRVFSSDEVQRWNRIIGNTAAPPAVGAGSPPRNATPGRHAAQQSYPLERRTPQAGLSAADVAFLGEAESLDPPRDDILERVVEGLKHL